MSIYVGSNNTALKIQRIYVGVDNVAREVGRVYVGIDNVAQLTPIFSLVSADGLTLAVRAGQRYPVQIHARGAVGDIQEAPLQLEYDPLYLELEDIGLEKPGGKTDAGGGTYTANFRILSREPGRISFKCVKDIDDGSRWIGLVLSARFRAVQTGDTDILLS